ncbi:MAG: response regulator [Zoogloea sp.]|nr:response regulator [Zoogloea sp.]
MPVCSKGWAGGVLGHTDYDLAIVDIGLPGMDGLELIRRVRRRGVLTPILILNTAQPRGSQPGADRRSAGP